MVYIFDSQDIQPLNLCCTTCPDESLPRTILLIGKRYFNNCTVVHNMYKLTTLLYMYYIVHLSSTPLIITWKSVKEKVSIRLMICFQEMPQRNKANSSGAWY